MGCRNRCVNNINRNGQVMGEFGITTIALRGPGCINGTGRCDTNGDDVLGEGGNRRCNRNNVQSTGGRNRHCDCCECLETPFTVPR